MSYGSEAASTGSFSPRAPRAPRTQKMGWGEATWRFVRSREGGTIAFKLLAMAGLAASVGDEPLDLIPGLDILTLSDDVLWVVIPGLAIGRIAWIRHRANRSIGRA